MSHRWLAHPGDAAYEMMMGLNRLVNRRPPLPTCPLVAEQHAKAKVKNAVEFISSSKRSSRTKPVREESTA